MYCRFRREEYPESFDQFRTSKNALPRQVDKKQFWENSKKEVSMFWKDSELGIECKARMDLYDADSMKIIDLKFTNNIGKFCKQKIMDQHFSIQAAWYRRGVYQLTGSECEFLFVFVEKFTPHIIRVMRVSEELIINGEMAILRAIKKIS